MILMFYIAILWDTYLFELLGRDSCMVIRGRFSGGSCLRCLRITLQNFTMSTTRTGVVAIFTHVWEMEK